MRLILPESINKFFWTLFPFVLLPKAFYNIFYDWQLQFYKFNELEDLGRLLIVIGLSACESALFIIFIWMIINLIKKAFKSK